MLRFLAGFTTAILLAVAGGSLAMTSGILSVAAVEDDLPIVQRLLHSTMRRSVSRHAGSIPRQQPFTEAQVQAGSEEYVAMCAGCHGAPGKMRSATGKGLQPLPPDLARAAEDWRSEEVFWIVKNGIKMTGMPAFGPTHSDQTLWNIVAFVKALPNMSANQYRGLSVHNASPVAPHEH